MQYASDHRYAPDITSYHNDHLTLCDPLLSRQFQVILRRNCRLENLTLSIKWPVNLLRGQGRGLHEISLEIDFIVVSNRGE